MTFVFEKLPTANVTLAIAYLVVTIYVLLKLLQLQSTNNAGLNTKKLFTMTCLLTAMLRFMSFSSMAILDLQRVHFSVNSSAGQLDNTPPESGDDNLAGSGNEEFFEKASLVLFDFPDFCCVSAYLLLIVVWAEAFIMSRRHWLSSFQYKRVWMFGYLTVNILLYTSQTALYSLSFIPAVDQNVLTSLIYLTLTVFNLGLPFLWLLIYIFLTIEFSGFPFASQESMERLKVLSRLGTIWTISRIGWGIVALTSVLQGWLQEAQKSVIYYSIILVVIFMFSEIIPIVLSVQNKTLQSLAEKDTLPVSTASTQSPLLANETTNPLLSNNSHAIILPSDSDVKNKNKKQHYQYSAVSPIDLDEVDSFGNRDQRNYTGLSGPEYNNIVIGSSSVLSDELSALEGMLKDGKKTAKNRSSWSHFGTKSSSTPLSTHHSLPNRNQSSSSSSQKADNNSNRLDGVEASVGMSGAGGGVSGAGGGEGERTSSMTYSSSSKSPDTWTWSSFF